MQPQLRLAVLFLVAAMPLAVVAVGHTAIYYYRDEHGVHHFTDAPTKAAFRILPAFGLPRNVNLTTGRYADLINRAAREQDIDPDLVKAIIRVESNFDPRAVSRKGAQGLMQLMPATAARHAVADAFDPAQNIAGGVRYLRKLIGLFPGDLRLVLAGYNAGENAVARHGGVPPYRETQQYVRKVLALYRSRAFDAPGTARGAPGASLVAREVTIPLGTTGGVYRSRDHDGRLLYTNAPR
jgi:soluble lytic murein transglycosylase